MTARQKQQFTVEWDAVHDRVSSLGLTVLDKDEDPEVEVARTHTLPESNRKEPQ